MRMLLVVALVAGCGNGGSGPRDMGGAGDGAQGPCIAGFADAPMFVGTTSAHCPAGMVSQVPVMVRALINNFSNAPLTLTSQTLQWNSMVPPPEPMWCGLSNTSTWTVTGFPIAPNTKSAEVMLQTTETCTGWQPTAMGGCDQDVDIMLETSCGTLHNEPSNAFMILVP